MNETKGNSKALMIGVALILLVILITFTKDAIEKNRKSDSLNSEENTDNTTYILPEELMKKMSQEKDNVIVIDIRDAESFKVEHIENSINIPMENLRTNYSQLNKTKQIIIVSSSFSQKEEVASLIGFLKSTGIENIASLSGGMYNWKESFYPTISSGNVNSFTDHSKVSYIKTVQLKIAIDNKYPVFIIDSRDKSAYNQGHIPNAVNIPFNELESRKSEIPLEKEVVIYSDSEVNDFKSAVKLFDLGFMATYAIDAGLAGWQQKGYEMVNSNQ